MRSIALLAGALLAAITCPAEASTPPSFSISDAQATEGGAIVFTITKSAKAASYSKITFTTHGGLSATYGVDFTPVSVTLTFSNNELVKKISVQTIQDSLVEGNETFVGAITAVRFATIGRGTASGTIVDDDAAPPPPPPPPPPEPVPNGKVRAILACQALNRPSDSLVIGQIYTVVEFASLTPIGEVGPATTKDLVVLNDATHLGDGYFGLYVPFGCVETV